MWFSIGLSINKYFFIGIASPYFQHMCCQIYQTVGIFMSNTKHR